MNFKLYLALFIKYFLSFRKTLFKYDTDKRVYAIGDIANSKCHQCQNEILIFFYSHYMREISNVVYKKTESHAIHSWNLTQSYAIMQL